MLDSDQLTLAPVSDLTDLTIADAAKLLEQRAISPVELVDAALARIERLNPTIHAFITVTADEARAKARDNTDPR